MAIIISDHPYGTKEWRVAYDREWQCKFKATHGMSYAVWRRHINPVQAAQHRATSYRNLTANPLAMKRKRGLELKRLQDLKHAAYVAYGGYVCACCGETCACFLSLDHMNNDGAAHRRLVKGTVGNNIYKWLKDNGYPEGFQVLCMNCNTGRYQNGGICPHNDPQWTTEAA